MSSRRETHDEEPRIRVAEGRNGFAPISFLTVCTAFDRGDRLTMRDEPGAALAACDLAMKLFERSQKPRDGGLEMTRTSDLFRVKEAL